MAAFAGQPIAHPTHWIAGLLYLAPVIVLAFAILWQRLNQRIDGGAAEAPEPPAEPDPPPSGR